MQQWSCCYRLAVVRVVLALFPEQLSGPHFVCGHTKAEAGHWGLGDARGTHAEGANDFLNFLVSTSGLHDPRRFKSPPAVCPCCCKVNGENYWDLCPALHTDTAGMIYLDTTGQQTPMDVRVVLAANFLVHTCTIGAIIWTAGSVFLANLCKKEHVAHYI